MKTVVVLGGSNTDLIATPSESPVRTGTSNPGRILLSPGGVGRNVAEAVARLGVPVALLSAVGVGPLAELTLERTRLAGVDVSRVRRATGEERSVYLAVHDQAGDLILGISEMSAMDLCSAAYVEEHRELIREAALLILDANVPVESAERALSLANGAGVPVLADPVSAPKAHVLASLGGELYLATPNRDEAPILQQGRLRVRHLLVTRGPEGVGWIDHSRKGERTFPVPPVEGARTNGAGDAFLAGISAGLYHGLALEGAIEWGIAAARLTLRSEETTDPELSRERIEEEVERCF